MLKKDLSYPDKLKIENKILLLEEYKGSSQKHKMKCLICGHIWSATPKSKIRNKKLYGKNGCPNCKKNEKENEYKRKRDNNIKKLEERGIIVLDEWDGRRHVIDEHTYTKIKVKNIKCGHVFECSPTNLLVKEVECAVCGPQKRVKPLIKWSKNNSKKWRETANEWDLYKSKVYELTRKTYKEYKRIINPKNVKRGKAGVDGAYHLDHIVPVRFCFDNNIPPELCAHYSNLKMVKWKNNISNRNHIKGSLPPLFLEYVDSGKRIKVLAESLKKDILPNSELFYQIEDVNITLYDKDNNVGIVIIPLDSSFANMKTAHISRKILMRNNIRHFIIFEDELNNYELIVNKIKHYLNMKTENIERIHARKCLIKLLDTKTKGDFLKKYHIQGNDYSKINYGAYYNDELVAVMTFTKPRVLLGYKNKDRKVYEEQWELSRFATNIKYRIPGIASKLLTNFKRDNQWNKIISYADKRWSTGNLYEKLGFIKESSNNPDYFYIVDGKRKHRWNYRKDKLKEIFDNYNPEITEYENMVNNGFYRLWDCGTFRYVLYK